MTTIDDEPPTVAERYGRATQSSNLKVEERRRGDADYLIAVGLMHDRLGALLYRLRVEYDVARANLRAVDDEAKVPDLDEAEADLARQADALSARPFLTGRQLAEYRRVMAEMLRVREERRTYRSTTRLFALLHLQTLRPARDAIWELARAFLPPKGHFVLTDGQARAVTGRVLDAWLDPLCGSCDGRGFNGGRHRGEQKVTCRGCGGMRLRRYSVGETAEERMFARKLHAEIVDAFTAVDRSLRALVQPRA